MVKRSHSDFLFAQPSFLSGAARVLDLGGTFDQYNTDPDADSVALASDWLVLGDDLFEVMGKEGVPMLGR